jgi:hypothetical protein
MGVLLVNFLVLGLLGFWWFLDGIISTFL